LAETRKELSLLDVSSQQRLCPVALAARTRRQHQLLLLLLPVWPLGRMYQRR
jgi:hypothetical protein